MKNTKIKNKNIISVILTRLYRTSTKSNMEINPELEEIIIGSLLGDLSAEKKNNKSNTRLQFKQSTKNTEYINHLYELFKDYCGTPPKIISYFDNRENKMQEYSAIKFQTFSLPCFNKYKELFYNSEGIKILPGNLEDLLTTKGLAYWIMDDGYKAGKGFYLCTESYSFIEHQLIVKIFKNKFDLNSSVHKTTNGNRIYIKSDSIKKLIELVKPHLLNHFYYKFDLYILPLLKDY
jgi:hypothetical protein